MTVQERLNKRIELLKKCNKCFTYKPISDFYKRSGCVDKTRTICKVCTSIKSKQEVIDKLTFVKSLEGEIWLPIEGYEGYYSVSNLSRVKSLQRTLTVHRKDGSCFEKIWGEKIKVQSKGFGGYFRIELSLNGINKSFYIHRLVCKAFHDNPENKPQVNHKNTIRTDNRPENLEWCTHQENIQHASQMGCFNASKESRKIANSKKVVNVNTGTVYQSIKDAAKAFSIGHSTLCDYLNGKKRINPTPLREYIP